MPDDVYEYQTLPDDEQRLAIARDVLAGLENDHYRVSLLQQPGYQARLAELEDTIARVTAEVESLSG